jgi:hypothetical protein
MYGAIDTVLLVWGFGKASISDDIYRGEGYCGRGQYHALCSLSARSLLALDLLVLSTLPSGLVSAEVPLVREPNRLHIEGWQHQSLLALMTVLSGRS